MAEAAARREARRRKILENSHNRLLIISGKSSDECLKESPIKTVIPEPEYDLPVTQSISNQSTTSHLNGALLSSPTDLLEFLSGAHDIDASGDAEVFNDLAPLLPPTGLPLPPTTEPDEGLHSSLWDNITSNKYDIVILSLLLQILYSLSITKFDGYFFLPVIVYIVTKLIWFPTKSSSGIANVLMLLSGGAQVRVQRLLYLTQCFGVITHDIFIFLFTTICIQSLFVTLNNYLVT